MCLPPLFSRHYSSVSLDSSLGLSSEIHRYESENFQKGTCALHAKHTVTAVNCFCSSCVHCDLHKCWLFFTWRHTKSSFVFHLWFLTAKRLWSRSITPHNGNASLLCSFKCFWLVWVFWSTVCWRKGCYCPLLMLTHIESTNLTVASPQGSVIFIHDMVIINWYVKRLLFALFLPNVQRKRKLGMEGNGGDFQILFYNVH